MDNLNDLKALWLTVKTDSLPDSRQMLRIVNKYRKQRLLKIISQLFTSSVMIVTILIVGAIYNSTMITTRIGEGLILVAGVILMGTNINSLNRMYRLKECSNRDFIKFLRQTQVRQLFYYKRTQMVATLVCTAGLAFYLYEEVYKSTISIIVVYTLIGILMLTGWFFIRPWFFQREAKIINATIERLETISKQF
jgi:hypothetical protein